MFIGDKLIQQITDIAFVKFPNLSITLIVGNYPTECMKKVIPNFRVQFFIKFSVIH